MAETPADRARKLGAIVAPQTVPVNPVSVQPDSVSTTSKEIPMSTQNTIAETVSALIAAGATPQQIAETIQALTTAQTTALAQTQPQPQATPAPVLATETKTQKPFVLGRPKKPFIPEKIEIYAPCRKDEKTGQKTDEPNGTLCLFLGTHSKIALGADEWRVVIDAIEKGIVREMLNECEKTGKKQEWKL